MDAALAPTVTNLTSVTLNSTVNAGGGALGTIALSDSAATAFDVKNGTAVTLTLNSGTGGVTATANANASIANGGPIALGTNDVGSATNIGTSTANRIRIAAGSGAVSISNTAGTGGSIEHHTTGTSGEQVALTYRVVLGPAARTGTYPWPLQLAVRPL